MIRIPGPNAREIEEQVAEHIETMVAQYDRRRLGPRTRRDGIGGGLRVDFTFDDTTPAIALEITSLAVPQVMALGAELIKLEADLTETVRSERLGNWVFGIRVGASVRSLKQPLLELLRAPHDEAEIVLYAAEDAGQNPAARALPVELRNLGLVSAARFGEGGELSIFPPITDATDVRGFDELLQNSMEANVSKLLEARPRETQLAIIVDRTDLSGDPALTPAPTLVEGIDVLWVIFGYYNAKYTYRVWRTGARDRRWQLLWHPWGEPPVWRPEATPNGATSTLINSGWDRYRPPA